MKQSREPTAVLTRLSLGYNCSTNLKLCVEAKNICYVLVFVVRGINMLVCANLVQIEMSHVVALE